MRLVGFFCFFFRSGISEHNPVLKGYFTKI